MTETPYNGSTAMVNKIEHLLGEKKISTPAVMRILLELKLEEIKMQHKNNERLELLEATSLGLKMYKYPKASTALIIAACAFFVSDIRQPVIHWAVENIKLLISLL